VQEKLRKKKKKENICRENDSHILFLALHVVFQPKGRTQKGKNYISMRVIALAITTKQSGD